MLAEMLTVDTSHGRETEALRPIAARLRAAGIPTELLESAPGRGNLVARLKGSGQKRPLLLLAHVDVVPVEGQPWTVGPFSAIEKEGFLWARGVGDDKAMAAASVAIMLDLARSKQPLARDVILALTAGEETGGSAGVGCLLAHHKPLIGDAEFALNEGGGLLLDDALSKVQSVSFGTAEKSYQTFRVVVKGKGGHSSVPPTDHDPALILARALVKIGEHKFNAHVLPDVRDSLRNAAAFEKAPLSDALRNAAASAPAITATDESNLVKDRYYNALIRTTCVTTMLSGSPKDNVLPTTAEAIVNCRILPDETREATKAALEALVSDPNVAITPVNDLYVGPASPIAGEVARAIEKVARARWGTVPVYPSMGTGATDSRHLRNAGILSYGVSASPTSIAEARGGHGAHGPDERLPVKWLDEGARFLRDLTIELAR